MKIEKFKIINFIRELIIYIDSNLENFPKKDIELKNRIRNNSYDLLEIAYLANSTTNVNYKKEKIEEPDTKFVLRLDDLSPYHACFDLQFFFL